MKPSEIKAKLIRFCAQRERSEKEVKEKLRELSAPESWAEELESEGWWNQERFARAYAFDHWNLNHWGKEKINQGLRAAGVSSDARNKAIESIPKEEYIQKLYRLFQRKLDLANAPISEEQLHKIRMYFFRKGYGWEDIQLAENEGGVNPKSL